MAADAFSRFLDLPYELRITIYRYIETFRTHPFSRFLRVSYTRDPSHSLLPTLRCRHDNANFILPGRCLDLPVTLSLCRESRADAQKRWKRLLSGPYRDLVIDVDAVATIHVPGRQDGRDRVAKELAEKGSGGFLGKEEYEGVIERLREIVCFYDPDVDSEGENL